MDIRPKYHRMRTPHMVLMDTILAGVREEVLRVHKQRGWQSYRGGTSRDYEPFAQLYRILNDQCVGDKAEQRRWFSVLLEEVYEAISEEDEVKLSQELTQVMAVCTLWQLDLHTRAADHD